MEAKGRKASHLTGVLLLVMVCGLTACARKEGDPVISAFLQATKAEQHNYMFCDTYALKLTQALRFNGGVKVYSRSMLLIHPREGRENYVKSTLQNLGLKPLKFVPWSELAGTSARMEARLPANSGFELYQNPQDSSTFYTTFDENAVTRYDGFCLIRIQNPAGSTFRSSG